MMMNKKVTATTCLVLEWKQREKEKFERREIAFALSIQMTFARE